MDTHTLFWMLNGEELSPEARVAITEVQESNQMFISAVTGWEAALAITKPRRAPDSGGRAADEWFDHVLRLPGARLIGVAKKVAMEAARVPAIAGWNDPFDCLLIATSRVRKIPIITRDTNMCRLFRVQPDYLTVIRC
jgi:PIN domain nuclease of toxin-antitoxin system